MMKKIFFTLMLLLVTTTLSAKSPKYIFFFIGDGMGLNIVNATESYLASRDGGIENKSLAFTQFPYIGVATTHCATRYITDSAAAGTALATGTKTYPGAIGVDVNKKIINHSLAKDAKGEGMATAVITNVTINHATPAAFYANQVSRKMNHPIALDGIEAGLDIYAGAGFADPVNYGVDVYNEYQKSGYTILDGKESLGQLKGGSKFVVMESDALLKGQLSYLIDRREGDMSINDILSHSIGYLKDKGKRAGFFAVIEGGMIDWAAHSNDGATAIGEVIDLDNAIKTALEFYEQQPEETLIVVTADHETGGFGLGTSKIGYDLEMKKIASQKSSIDIVERVMKDEAGDWATAKEVLKRELGMWRNVEISKEEEETLKAAFHKSSNKLVKTAIKIFNEQVGLGWTTTSHTGSPVMVWAIGNRAEQFSGKLDNTDISKKLQRMITGK